jgi:hypothetical protein
VLPILVGWRVVQTFVKIFLAWVNEEGGGGGKMGEWVGLGKSKGVSEGQWAMWEWVVGI